MDKPRVVFDCMNFLQAAARPNGPAAALLELVEIGELELFISDAKYVDLAIAAKADFLVTRDKDLLDLREQGSPLLQIFEKLDWRCKIVDPFEMLTYFRALRGTCFSTS